MYFVKLKLKSEPVQLYTLKLFMNDVMRINKSVVCNVNIDNVCVLDCANCSK